jgi:hypothetical protein
MPEIIQTDAGMYEATVDGHVYEFAKWGAEEAMNTLLDLSDILGKPLSRIGAKAFSRGVKEALAEEISDDLVGDVIGELVASVGQYRQAVLRVVRKLTSHKCLCDGKRFDFDTHYARRLTHMYKVAAAALEVQYGNFFDAVGDILPRRPPKARDSQPSAA